MNKFYLTTLYIYLTVIFLFFSKLMILNITNIIMLLINLIYLIIKRKKTKLDKIDLLLLIIPLSLIIILIFKLNVFSIFNNILYLIRCLTIATTIIIIRRLKVTNSLFTVLQITTLLSFIISIFNIAYPSGIFNKLGIVTYFGDTYYNSIDRMYGVLNYCNSTALQFLITFYISLLNNKQNIFNKIVLFISMIGFLFTFSKMYTIAFIIMTILCIIYNFILNKHKVIKHIIIELSSLLIPSLLAIRLLRYYLINNNLILFILLTIIIFLVYYIIYTVLSLLKNKIIIYTFIIIELLSTIILLIKPISIPLEIKNATQDNSYYITEFLLEDGKTYNIEIDYENNSGEKPVFIVQKGYEKNYIFKSLDYIILKSNKFTIIGDKNVEYYLLKLSNITKNTNLEINKITVNGKEQRINTFLIPYQIDRQISLSKYDVESVSDRGEYIKKSLEYEKNNYFLWGNGYKAFKYYNELDENVSFKSVETLSIICQYWLEFGLIGVIYIILIWLTVLLKIFKNYKKYNNQIIFIIFCLINMFSMFDLILSNEFLLLIMLLSYGIINKVEKGY